MHPARAGRGAPPEPNCRARAADGTRVESKYRARAEDACKLRVAVAIIYQRSPLRGATCFTGVHAGIAAAATEAMSGLTGSVDSISSNR